VRARLDTRIRDSERAARHLDAPSIGVLLQDPELARLKVLPGSSTAPAAETLRQVGTNLDFIDVDNPPRVLTITSSVPGEGKTTLATNLAIQLAGDGKRVVLVDADLRRPRAARFLGAAEGAGLTQVLNGSAPLADVLQQIGDSGRLHFLAAGPAVPNPGALLGSARMAELLETLRQTHDVVLLDAAPLLAVADTSRLVPLTDGAVVCARWGAVHDRELAQTRRTLARVGARTLGVVLTFLPRSAAAEVGYGSVYGEDAAAGKSWRDQVARRLGRSRPAAPPTEPTSGASPAAPAADQPLGEPATTPPDQEAGAQVVALPADQRRDDLTRPIVLPAAAVGTPEVEPATRL
jgi:capsular exopolysaccharide synthesis family protein